MRHIIYLTLLYAVAVVFFLFQPPPEIIIIALGALIVITGMVIGQMVLESQRGRPQLPPPPDVSDGRVTRLQAQLEAIAEEVERIGEGQRFLTRILAEREEKMKPLPLGSGSPQRNTPPH